MKCLEEPHTDFHIILLALLCFDLDMSPDHGIFFGNCKTSWCLPTFPPFFYTCIPTIKYNSLNTINF